MSVSAEPVRFAVAQSAIAFPASVTAPVFTTFSIDAQGKIIITGKADPFSEIDLVCGAKLLGQIRADENGNFEIGLIKRPRVGEYRYVLRSTDKNGQSATSVQTLVVSVNNDGSAPITAIIDEPNGTQRIVYPLNNVSGDDGASEKLGFTVEYIAYENGHFIVCGNAPANRRVAIHNLDLILGSEFIKETGRFCIERTNRLAEGDYALKAQLLDEKGQIFANVTLPFTISNLNKTNEQYYVANKPVETVVVRPGETLSQIAQRLYGDYNFADKIYQLNRHVLENPHNVQAGQRLALPPKQ
ncbi:LysM peptidoglycan-binding domain-containing protein [Bartonella sp. HY329]|uniref:LysM peptidoglycan-binding domain-containing protein n=1 Tax=unclassified Bartonella TaxID=2645622 RepID=UPI0021C6212E|nr:MULTISPECIES: LysM domain-containing protein [unclassified Bartonella]UXM94377.1 LysM peptidoglycan-binding domain-containing protein [Bartonella sp. HY329]UXN08700.1 LysM peptidoglycan-binding domain-containing protein [Bartonella sp. HY328]